MNRLHTEVRAAPPSFTPACGGVLQRKCACGGSPGFAEECGECNSKRLNLQREATHLTDSSAVPPIVHDVLHSPGQPLDAATRAFMEPRFGHDFSRVRVHTDAQAGASARSVGANAYTIGNRIVFAPQQFKPETEYGRRMIAHELAHVVQQQGTRTEIGAPPHRISEPGDASEMQAEASATQVMQHALPAQVGATTHGVIQRDNEGGSAGRPSGGGRRVPVQIAVRGDCQDPEKIAEAIPGARSMLTMAENWFISYAAGLVPEQQRLFDMILRAHFGSSSTEVRRTVHSRIIRMSRLLDSAINAGVIFDCTPGTASECGEHPSWAMFVRPREHNIIHVCPEFFTSGLELRRFTLVHEAAHIAGVGDRVYLVTAGPIGLAECITSSELSTDVALDNADRYAGAVWCLSREPGATIIPGLNIHVSKP